MLIAKCKYVFNIPIKAQKGHLTDFNHLDKAHWLTLWGVKVGQVEKKTSTLAKFDLHRFGQVRKIVIIQTENFTVVNMGASRLEFLIEPINDKQHYLHASFFSNHWPLILLWPLIQLVFWLTVIEDCIYYAEHSK